MRPSTQRRALWLAVSGISIVIAASVLMLGRSLLNHRYVLPGIEPTNQRHTIYYDVSGLSATDVNDLQLHVHPHHDSDRLGGVAHDARCLQFLNLTAYDERANERWVYIAHRSVLGWMPLRFLVETRDCKRR